MTRGLQAPAPGSVPGRPGSGVRDDSFASRMGGFRVSALRAERSRERQAVRALGCYTLTLFVFPSDLVLRVVGAQGYVAGLVALALLLVWVLSVLLGGHDPRTVRHPTRGVVAWLAATSLVCWALTPFHGLTLVQQLSADRWIMLIAASAGMVLVTAEGVLSRNGVIAVLRLAVFGAAFCAFVALLQWLLLFDLGVYLRQLLPGFSVNSAYSAFQARGALQRVTGTSLHPIELGVVAGMMIPIAIVVAMYDRARSGLRRWVPVVLIASAIPASVSRSAVLAVTVAVVFLIVTLPPRPRVAALVLVPIGAVCLVLARPGYVTTLATFFVAGSDDASVASRLDDYPMVERLVSARPWFGTGGGTFMPENALDILDNQYLKGAVELGAIGLTGQLAWLLVPIGIALAARGRSTDPVLRTVCGALSGAAAAAALSSATFDSLSFNMFAGVHALVVGCIGACWVLSRRENRTAPLVAADTRS
ncbi:O-antigen ligase family protein [Geodermatophilus nigrescens]